MPREGRFFDFFNEHAELVVQASHELAALMASGDDLERRAHNIESIEKKADRITRSTIETLPPTSYSFSQPPSAFPDRRRTPLPARSSAWAQSRPRRPCAGGSLATSSGLGYSPSRARAESPPLRGGSRASFL